METVQKRIPSPIGTLGVVLKGEKIWRLSFLSDPQNEKVRFQKRSAARIGGKAFSFFEEWIAAYFDRRDPSPFPWELLDLDSHTDFEKRVWQELWKIPFGKAESYRSIAEKIGIPRGSRAIGQANGRNPIPLLIPCHRVISADGTLGGFSSGITLKKKLLAHEGFPGDEFFMSEAIKEGVKASERGEIPIGAVIVREGEIIARAFNRREKTGNPLDHAEMIALRAASKRIGSWRLNGCTLYVTLEPCPMCLGALLQSRVRRVVYGCHDPKRKSSFIPSIEGKGEINGNNHRTEVTGGILGNECASLLKAFFEKCR